MFNLYRKSTPIYYEIMNNDPFDKHHRCFSSHQPTTRKPLHDLVLCSNTTARYGDWAIIVCIRGFPNLSSNYTGAEKWLNTGPLLAVLVDS